MSTTRRLAKLPSIKPEPKSDKNASNPAKIDQPHSKTPNTKQKTKPKKSPVGSSKAGHSKSHSESAVTPPKSNLKLSISANKIDILDDTPLSNLDALNNSSSSENASGTDPLNELPELDSDEITQTPIIEIPQEVRLEAGQNWRLKEAILNSFIFGKPSIKSQEFARSDSDIKTAEVVASNEHSLDSKKFRVKLHLGRPFNFASLKTLKTVIQLHCLANYRRWVKSVTHYTATISGKRKFETILGDTHVVESTPDAKGNKNRKLANGKPQSIVHNSVGLSDKFDIYVREQTNLENLR